MTRLAPSYWTGRHASAALVVWVLALLLSLALWRQQFETYLLGQGLPRLLPAAELAGVLGACFSAPLLVARLPVIDRLSTRRLGAAGGWTAAFALLGFTGLPLLVKGVAHFAPDLMPVGTLVAAQPDVRTPVEILSTTLTLSISVNIAFFASIAFLATLLLGRAWGPAFAIASYGLVMVGQSSSVGPDLIPLAGAGTEPYALHTAGVALAAVLLATTAACWGWTRAIPRRGEG